MSLFQNRKKTPRSQLIAEYRERQEMASKEAREALWGNKCPRCGSPIVFSHSEKKVTCSQPPCEYRAYAK